MTESVKYKKRKGLSLTASHPASSPPISEWTLTDHAGRLFVPTKMCLSTATSSRTKLLLAASALCEISVK